MAKSAFTAKLYTEAHAENDAMSVSPAVIVAEGPPEASEINTAVDAEFEAVEEAEALDGSLQSAEPLVFVGPELGPEYDALLAEDEAAIEALDTDIENATLDVVDNVITDVVLEPQASQGTFEEMLAAITDEDAIAMAVIVGKAIDERQDFERAKGNDNIQKALTKSRKQLATPTAARVLIACAVDPSMINRSVHEGVRYNVYALGKLADAIHGLSGGAVNNAINVACMKSLFRFKAAGKDFTGEMAKAAASDKLKVDLGLKGLLVRHTVSASTSSTQASSTMQALTTLGIVSRAGSHKNPTFTLTETAVVAKLQRVIGEAIAA